MKKNIKKIFIFLFLNFTALHYATEEAKAEIESQAFSGINEYVPVHARIPIYKIKAMHNKVSADLAKFADIYPGKSAVSAGGDDCSVNIGNIVPGNTVTGNFGNKETIVLIEGDVVNASSCK